MERNAKYGNPLVKSQLTTPHEGNQLYTSHRAIQGN
jgi:hypothetical protein